MESLIKAIQSKQTTNFVDMLEKKYGVDPKKKKNKAWYNYIQILLKRNLSIRLVSSFDTQISQNAYLAGLSDF